MLKIIKSIQKVWQSLFIIFKPSNLQLVTKPYHLLGVTALLILILSFFFANQSLDLHVHATYFVLTASAFFKIMAVFLFVSWLLYRVTRKLLFSRMLSWTHISTTLLATFVIVAMVIRFIRIFKERNHDSLVSFRQSQNTNQIIVTAASIFIVVQLLFVTNIVAGLIKEGVRMKNKEIK